MGKRFFKKKPKEAKIKVGDNGQGIDAIYLPKIFNMFYKANTYNTGSGLGLYIVKEAVSKLNGTVEVASQKGVYTEFVITIPNI